MRRPTRRTILAYALGLSAVAAASAINGLLASVPGQRNPFLLFFLPVILASWWGGWRPALLAILTSALVVAYFFVPPTASLQVGPVGAFHVGVFVLEASLIAALSEYLLRSEQILGEEREWSRVTLAGIGDAVLAADTAGRVRSLNPAAEALCGWSVREAVGRPFGEVCHLLDERSRAPLADPVERVCRSLGQAEQVGEAVLATRDGSERPVEYAVRPIRDGGRASGVVVVCRDVTGRRHLEALREEMRQQLEAEVRARTAELQASEERFRLLVEGARDYAIFLLDPQGHIVTWNTGAERIKGYRAQEIIGRPLDVFYSEEDVRAGKARRELAQAEAEGRYEEEGWRFRKDGTRFWAHVVLTALRDEQRRLRGFSKITHDDTTRKQAEENARRLLEEQAARHAAEAVAAEARRSEEIVQAQRAERERLLIAEHEARAEAEHQRDLMRRVFDNAPISIGLLEGPEYRFTLVNPATLALTGQPAEAFLGRPHAQAVPQAHAVIGPLLDEVLGTGRAVIRPDLELPLADGRTVYLHLTLAPLPGPDGRPVGVLYLALDRTEQRWAERERERLLERLEEERAFLETVIRQMPGGVFIAEAPSGRILLRNQLSAGLLGMSIPPPQTLAEYDRYQPFFHDDRHPAVADWPLVRALKTGEVVVGEEMNFVRGDGSHGTIRVSAAPIRSGDERIIAAVTTFFDVTEQKRAVEALRFLAEASSVLASSLDYPTTLASVAQLVVPRLADWCTVDVIEEDGVPRQLAVAHVDPAKVEWARKLHHHYPPDPHAAHGVPQVLRTGEPELMADIPDEMLVQGARDAEHLRILRGLGLKSYMVVPLRSRDRTLGTIAFAAAESGRRYGPADLELAQDLARRAAQAVDNARLFDQARRAERRKDEFLAMLAHELRNPLAPLRTALHVLHLRASSDPVAEQMRDMMERQVGHMTRLVEDLLDVSRITRGKIELRRQAIDLAALVGQAVETVRPLIEERRHRLEVSLPPGPLTLEADPARLEQVLVNLLNNAAKYTEPGGHIRLSGEREPSWAVVRVRDTGIGIRPEALAHLFDLFTQADRLPHRPQEGLGIGLALVRSLVQMHGGSVEAHSPGPGQGSEFVVRWPLPAAPAGDAARPQAADEPGHGRPLRVLVVDDNMDAANSLAQVLRMGGDEIEVAHDGPSALERARAFGPDAVLLDIGLPRGMDGYEVARRLRQMDDVAGALLVAITGWGQEEDRRRSREAGFDHHLTKPVDLADLRRLLASRRMEANGAGH